MTENEAKWEYCRAIDIIKRIKIEETHGRYIDRHKAFDLAIQALGKVQKFEAIGNIEEFKALKEKIEPKKPIDKLMYLECPTCGDVGIEDCAYCPCCGQKLDWQ